MMASAPTARQQQQRTRSLKPSFYDGAHSALASVPQLSEQDLAFTPEDLNDWFELALASERTGTFPYLLESRAKVHSRHQRKPSAGTSAAHQAAGDGYAFGDATTVGHSSATLLTLADAALVAPSNHHASSDAAAAASSVVFNAAANRDDGGLGTAPDIICRTPVFLRAYSSGLGKDVDVSYLLELATFCASNDPAWAHSVQLLALQALTGILDPSSMPVSGPARVTATAVNALPMAFELRRAWTDYSRQRSIASSDSASACPHISVTNCHFVFRIEDTAGAADDDDNDDGADAFFSAQVQITNNGKPCDVTLGQTLAGEDGALRPLAAGRDGVESGVDYHVAVDKSTIKRGETSSVLVSLIVRPSAEFGVTNLVAAITVGSGDVHVKVFVTVTLINPHAAVFGSPAPLACTSIVHNPLGTYRVPAVLATLLGVYFARNGPTAAARGPLLADSAEDNAAVARARSEMDDTGHAPFLSAIRTDSLPQSVALLAPNQLLSAALLWLCEYPTPILPPMILSSDDPMMFLSERVPSECHGVVLSVIDACCKIAVSHEHPCLTQVAMCFGHALANASMNVIMGQRGTAEQVAQAAECARCAVEHLVAWVDAFMPRYLQHHSGSNKGAMPYHRRQMSA